MGCTPLILTDVPSPGFPWSHWLFGPPWAPRCGGEYGGEWVVGWGSLWKARQDPSIPSLYPTGPSGTERLQGVPGE
jgi:hypothetical protein